MIIQGDCLEVLKTLPKDSVQCCVTSPPYWGLRDYRVEGQMGLEKTPEEYVGKMVEVFREVRRILRKDGTIWLNLGDSYARNGGVQGGGNRELLHLEGKQHRMTRIPEGAWKLKEKDLVGIPWSVAFALQADGWWLRQDIIWHKPNAMPESVTDRCTKAHEYIFLLTKSARYYYDAEAIKEPMAAVTLEDPRARNGERTINGGRYTEARSNGESVHHSVFCCPESGLRNKRSVWTVNPQPYSEAHFATFPPDLIKPCLLAGSKPGDTILDPFGGSGTTGMVATELGREFILIELNPQYCRLAEQRCRVTPGLALA